MINGYTTFDKKVSRNWRAKPRWWEISVDIPYESALYLKAQRELALFYSMRGNDAQAITAWLEQNIHGRYEIGGYYVRFQNETDALMFFLALK